MVIGCSSPSLGSGSPPHTTGVRDGQRGGPGRKLPVPGIFVIRPVNSFVNKVDKKLCSLSLVALLIRVGES